MLNSFMLFVVLLKSATLNNLWSAPEVLLKELWGALWSAPRSAPIFEELLKVQVEVPLKCLFKSKS